MSGRRIQTGLSERDSIALQVNRKNTKWKQIQTRHRNSKFDSSGTLRTRTWRSIQELSITPSSQGAMPHGSTGGLQHQALLRRQQFCMSEGFRRARRNPGRRKEVGRWYEEMAKSSRLLQKLEEKVRLWGLETSEARSWCTLSPEKRPSPGTDSRKAGRRQGSILFGAQQTEEDCNSEVIHHTHSLSVHWKMASGNCKCSGERCTAPSQSSCCTWQRQTLAGSLRQRWWYQRKWKAVKQWVQTRQLPPESPSPPRNPVSYYVNICTVLRLRCQKTSSRGKQAKTSLLLQVQILDHVNRVCTVKNCFEISHFNIRLLAISPQIPILRLHSITAQNTHFALIPYSSHRATKPEPLSPKLDASD